jgi:SAM-dependent methyltransferase
MGSTPPASAAAATPAALPRARLDAIAARERVSDRYWSQRDPINDLRTWWRAQTARHLFHLLPGETILELGCGSGRLTRALVRATRGECPITAASFAFGPAHDALKALGAGVEVVSLADFPGELTGRTFDYMIASNLLDLANAAPLLQQVQGLLRPGGRLLFFETNPWNPVFRLRRRLGRWLPFLRRGDERALPDQIQLYELLSDLGYVRIAASHYDFLYWPIPRWLMLVARNLSLVLENTPGLRRLAGIILLHAQRPPRDLPRPPVRMVPVCKLHGTVSVVVPCHNEEMNVVPLVEGLRDHYDEYIHEFILVDDNSTDRTREVIEELAAREPRVRPVIRQPPNGVGRALRDGLRRATGEYVLLMDCDFLHLLPELREMFDAAADGCEVVLGSRFSRESVLINYPLRKILFNRTFHALANLLFHRRMATSRTTSSCSSGKSWRTWKSKPPGSPPTPRPGSSRCCGATGCARCPSRGSTARRVRGSRAFPCYRTAGATPRCLARWPGAPASASAAWPRRRASRPGRGPASDRTCCGTHRAEKRRMTTLELPVADQTRRRVWPRRWLAGAVLFAVAALLRVGLVDRHGLWADELFSLAMATGHSLEHPAAGADPAQGDYTEAPDALSPSAYSRYLAHDTPPAGPQRVIRAVFLSDTSPPLYYLLLYGWTRAVGTSDAALRLFSVAWALACFPLLWSLARQVGGRAAALPTCVLFTFAPLCIYYSTEGRMYSLLWFWTVLAMWLTLRLQRQGVRLGLFLSWVAAGAAGLLTHYFFAFVWLAALAWLMLHPGRLPRKVSVAGAALTALMVVPWYVRLPESLAHWRVTGDWLTVRPDRYHPLIAFLYLPWSFFSIHGPWGVGALRDAANCAVFVVLGLVVLKKLGRSLLRPRRQLLWLWLLAAWLGLVAFDLWRGTYVIAQQRYALAGMPAAFLLAGLGLGHLRPAVQGVFLTLIILAGMVGIRQMYLNDSRSWEPTRQVGELLAAEAGASDLVIVHSIPSGVAGVARAMEARGNAPGVGFVSWVGRLGRRRVPDDLQRLAAGRKTIFLVRIHEVGEPAPEETWLEQNATPVRAYEVDGVTIRAFLPRDTARLPGEVRPSPTRP